MTNKEKDLLSSLTPEMMEMIQLLAKQMSQSNNIEDVKPSKKTKKKSVEKPQQITKKYLREKYQNETITLVNLTNGTVTYKSPKGGFPYIWKGYGDSDELSIDDLLVMPRKYLTAPWLMIVNSDGDIIDGLGLQDYYKYIHILDDVEDIENLEINELEKALKVFAPSKSREFVNKIACRVQEKIDSGELDSNRKIMQLEKILGKEFVQPNKL